MLMSTLVILRFTGIFTAYTGITVLLPEIMFRRILKGRRLSEQFLMSYTFGNFYIINIVFALQLLHISNFFTLTAVTVLMSILIGLKVNRIPLRRKLAEGKKIFCRLSDGSLGIRSAVSKFGEWMKSGCRYFGKFFCRYIVKKPIQSVFLIFICGALLWIYGRQIILTYGYRASDIPVHLSWINQMSRGKIFSKGVYPFGFHCMIYYLHTVFGVDTYVILCEFFFVQVIYLHAVLLVMLKLLCKTKYLPYIGVFAYIVGDFWSGQTYSRFYSTLPQEYGMIFVIPSIYFLIRFFQIRKENLKDRETRRILQCFAMAFSLTLAIHFYGTMIAGLCCIGIAMGFCFRFVKKEYFCRIMVTGILSVVLAVLPMAIAFAGGTPLQGSLGWGIAETGAGQHGVATATAAALMGMECEVFMGKEDTERQALNVYRMRLLGAKVHAVTSGTATLKDAVSETMREWTNRISDTHYVLGSVMGPHPFPTIVRDFQAVISKEIKEQILEKEGKLPDAVLACVGGGSNAIGTFYNFIEDEGVRLIGCEAAGRGVNTAETAATIATGKLGIFHGMKSYFCQDEYGQIAPVYSISAGLDYPGVGPEHAHLYDIGRAEYVPVTDDEAVDAFEYLSRTEGIIPAIESAHAVAYARKIVPQMRKDQIVVITISGRGDKDCAAIARYRGEDIHE